MRMLADGAIVRQPFDTIAGTIAGSADGAILAPGAAIPVHKMNTLQSGPLTRTKAAGMVVLSAELLAAQQEAEGLITRSLRRSVGAAVDRAVFATLLLSAPAALTSQGLLKDAANLLTSAGLTDESRPYFVASPDVAIRLAVANDAEVQDFPDTTWNGGSIYGILCWFLVVSMLTTCSWSMLLDLPATLTRQRLQCPTRATSRWTLLRR